MLELVEAKVLAEQMNQTIQGKIIKNVIAAKSPHKFAWYFGDPQNYHNLLAGKRIEEAVGVGGMLEIKIEDAVLLIGDGATPKFHQRDEKRPEKHQLLIEFDDLSALSASVQMYGGIWCFIEGENDNPYYLIAKEKPSPITNEFDQDYFNQLLLISKIEKLSVKAFLATEQRIPGLGNGVLQDILFYSGIHPKKKLKELTKHEIDQLFVSIKSTLNKMIEHGGRDTEKDLYGNKGGYQSILSKNTVGKPCPVCGTLIQKEAYLGGSIYYCEECQPN